MLFLLMAVFGFSSAQADQLSDFGYKSADELNKSNYSSKKENGLTTLKTDLKAGKSLTFLSQEKEYVAQIGVLGKVRDNSQNFARFIQIGPSGNAALSTTLCSEGEEGSKKLVCRTQTMNYCRYLSTHISRNIFTGDLVKLKECASILDKLKFDPKEVEAANATAMAVIKKHLPEDQFENRINPPNSLKDLLEDFAACRNPHMKWEKPSNLTAKTPKQVVPVRGQN